jgi:two-component system, sensor histidine kinase and response regulator
MTRVLIIDDDIDVRDQIATVLLGAYYETHTAVDGQDGVDKALHNPPDLIVCDMMMPNMNGQEVLTELRKHNETATVPFIFLTAVEDRDTVRASMNLGADDYLFKPFQTSDLVRAVSTRLKRQREIVATVEDRLEVLKLRLARTVTHELRTPLGLIITSLQVMSAPNASLPPDEMNQMLELMKRGTDRLSHCIEQMVYATYLTTGVISPTSVAENGLKTVVKDLVEGAMNTAKQFTIREAQNVTLKITVDSEDNMYVKGDTSALRQALAELISNALTFSPRNGNVRISYKKIQDDVRITITDNGPGIPDDRLKEALDWFGQIDRETQEQQGLGLGLPLASQLIEMHGGSLEIRSILHKGTQAVVTLPLMS